MTQNKNLTLIQFLVINKDLFRLNKSNADVLVQNASKSRVLALNFHVSKEIKSVLHTIIKSGVSLTDDNILVSKIIQQSNLFNDDETQNEIYQDLLKLEKEIIQDKSIKNTLNKLYNNKNFNATLN